MKTTQAIQALVQETVEQLGYDLIEVAFKKEQTDWVLTLYIDGPNGVGLDDCETVSRAVEPILDEADPIAQSYFLSVSSPGLDRPLKSERDYKRNLNKQVVIKLYQKKDNKKEFVGALHAYDENGVTLLCADGQSRFFLIRDIALIKPYIDFK